MSEMDPQAGWKSSKQVTPRLSQLDGALGAMRTALSILDEENAPADIGAHLDLAICRLEDLLKELAAATPFRPEDGANIPFPA